MFQIILFIVLLALVVLGGEALNWLLVRGVPYRIYRWVLAPGIIVHELSHAVACFVVGAQVHELALLSPTGGHVQHTEPRVPYIGNALVALAPLVGGLAVIVAALAFLAPDLFQTLLSTDLSHSITNIYQEWFAAFVYYFDPFSFNSWLLIVLILTVGASLAPSMVDLRSAGVGLAIAAIATIWQLWLVVFLFIAVIEVARHHQNIVYVVVDALLLGGGGYLLAQTVSPSVAREVLTVAALLSFGAILLGIIAAGALYAAKYLVRRKAN